MSTKNFFFAGKYYSIYRIILGIISIAVLFLFFISCDINNDDDTKPPCINCPVDFRLTDIEPAWSPDGKTIAYVHGDTVESKTGLFLIDTSGLNKRLLLSSASASSPSWSFDGKWLVFSMSAQIYKIKANGDSLTQLTNQGSNFFPSFSPDGNWIAYDSNVDSPNGMNFIWKMKSDGTHKIRIAYDPTKGEIRMPSWSSITNKIMHIRYLPGVFSSEIFEMDADGYNAKRLTFNDHTDYYPKFNHNNNKIVFESQPYASFPKISVIDKDGNNYTEITDGSTCDWSPDGQYIVYTYSKIISGMLWIMKNDGSNKRQLTYDN
ncbi:MAG: DUF5050 domain-containing protein [Ignavibacteriales bacterium]|nr:DUF5050 domain-containing protein [Ignavibacteriales bacterium]